MADRLKAGFIGMGIMGAPMAGHLISHGHAVTVWNRTVSRCEPLRAKGAAVADSPAAMAVDCDVIFTNVTDGPDVEAVLFGEGGFVTGLSRRQNGTRPVVVDLSTISPPTAQSMGVRLAELGIDFLDAPVTGGDVGARNATLTIMVGGDEAVLDRCRPLLECMSKRIVHVGPSGSGQMVKACNQILCAVNMVATCEALSLAKKCGLDLTAMMDVVTSGAGGSWALDQLGRKIITGDLNPAFMIRLIQKDLRAVMEAARGANVALPGTALAMEMFRAVEASGGEDLGTQAMIKAYERLSDFQMGDPTA